MKRKNRRIRPIGVLLLCIVMLFVYTLPVEVLAQDGAAPGSITEGDGNSLGFAGNGTEITPYLITSAGDWDALSNHINNGGTDYSGAYFKLTDDISVSTMLGYRNTSNVDIPFVGTFDGDGHTLNVSINYNGPMAAPFGCVCNAVIKNLKVTGTVKGGIHSSGLVGAGNQGAITGSTLEVYNVTTSVAVNGYNNTVTSHQGGIVGHTLSARITMDNVVFSGSLNASSAQGGFIGWGGGADEKISVCELSNCLFAGTVRSGNTFHPVGYAYNNYGKATLTNFYTTKDKNNDSNHFDFQGTSYILINGVTAKVEDGGAIRYYDSFASAISSTNWTQGSTLTLLSDVSISNTMNVPTGEHTLDLNGHGIKKTGTGCVIKVNEQSTLNLKDSDTSKEHKYKIANPIGNGAGVATVDDTLTSGYQTFTGGYITGGYITGGYNYGAGINVEGNGAALNMYGGTIIGNRLTAGSTGGGGVCLQDWDKSGGFNMYGGLIIGNTANYGGGVYVRCGKMVMYNGEISNNVANNNIGGALLAFGNSSTFIMEDGVINGNYAQHGGAIEASGGAAVSIFGGTITNNTATGKGGALTNQRSDVDTSPAVFNISGAPVFSGNTAGGKSGDVYLCNTAVLNLTDALTNTTPFGVSRSSTTGTFTSGWKDKMGSADPSNYFTSDNSNYEVFLNSEGEAVLGIPPVASITSGDNISYYTDLSSAVNAWKNGGKLTLIKDVTYNDVLYIRPMYGFNAGSYTLDLNGKTFKVSSIQVGLDNSPNTLRTGPKLTVEDSATGGTVRFASCGMIDYGGLIELRGGTFTGGNGTWGGLFLLHIYASLDMYDGVTITGNTSTYGGAVLVGSDSEFNMYGGKISGNNATDSGGGVVVFDNDAARFNMYGGEISGNRAPKGGGVSVNAGQFHICGNNAVIKDNVSGGNLNSETGAYTGGTPNNVYLPSGKKIYIDSQLSTTPIGVTAQNGAGSFTSGLSGKGTVANFVSDNSAYEIRLVNGEAYIGPPHTHNWVYSADKNVLTATCSGVAEGCCDIGFQTLTVSAAGKTYDGTPVTATVTQSDGWTAANGLTVPGIVYSGNTDAGTYTASVSSGGKTAAAEFTISEKSMADEISATGYTGDYDGNAYGITVNAPTGAAVKYGIVFGSYTLDEMPTFTNAGVYTVYYQVTRKNYITNTGAATVDISPINATVTVIGNNGTADYDGEEHTVAGYTATADTDLYDVAADFTFSGDATAALTDVGTVNMGLNADQFENINVNFATVTFVVTDGYQTLLPVDAVVTTAPVTAKPVYDGSAKALVIAGAVDGGTLYYALGKDEKNAPDDNKYSTALPVATELGSYYVWYKTVSDSNHNDLAPVCVKVTLAESDWVTISGVLYRRDGKTPVADAVMTLVDGYRKVDYVITDEQGNYRFTVPAGVYNIVAEYESITETTMVTALKDVEQDLVMPGGNTVSLLKVSNDLDDLFSVAVGGLNREARFVRQTDNVADDKSVSVLMTVEPKTEQTALNGEAFSSVVKNKSLIFFDAKVEKTVDSITTVLNETTNVLEIAVPYEKVGKRGLAVYLADGTELQQMEESDSKESGTFSVDKENGLVYIYSNRFATFAIGYTPYYHIDSDVSLGSFEGDATVTLQNNDDGSVYTLENVKLDQISFADIPKGEYTMTITWVDGVSNTLTMPFTVS